MKKYLFVTVFFLGVLGLGLGSFESVSACERSGEIKVTNTGSTYSVSTPVTNCAQNSVLRYRIYINGQIDYDTKIEDIAVQNSAESIASSMELKKAGTYTFELFQVVPSPSKVLGSTKVTVGSTPPTTPPAPSREPTQNTPPPNTETNQSPPVRDTTGATATSDPCARLSGNFSSFGGGETVSTLIGSRCYSTGGFITKVLEWLLGVAGALAVLMFVVGGYRYMSASGNAEAMTSAKKIMKWALVGLGVVLLAYTIVTLVTRVFLSGEIL